ncbi:hypothetical protein ACSBR1_017741 [Camellia fascicularis]
MANELRTPLTHQSLSFLKACFNTTNAFLVYSDLIDPILRFSYSEIFTCKGEYFEDKRILRLHIFREQFLFNWLTFYTGLLLKTCLDADPSIRSYLDIAEQAFGKTG